MARKKHKKKRPVAEAVPLERMQQLWRLGQKVVPSKRGYQRRPKHPGPSPED